MTLKQFRALTLEQYEALTLEERYNVEMSLQDSLINEECCDLTDHRLINDNAK